MSIWNRVLVALIAVVSLGFFYLAARTLKVHEVWHNKCVQTQQELNQLKAEKVRLIDGVERDGKIEEAGIRQLRLELYKVVVDRRRAWFNCPARVNGPNRATGTADIVLTIDKPSPNGIAQNTVLYAFDDADNRSWGQYLGQYTVARVAGKQIALRPAGRLTGREILSLEAARASGHTWTLYESMPQDNHEIFATLSDELKKKVLPPQFVAEYLKDGRPAAKGDPKQNIVEGKYVRTLRDYDVLFRANEEKDVFLRDAIVAAAYDGELVKTALASAQKQADALTRNIATAKEEKAVAMAQRDLVAKTLAKFQESLDKTQLAVKETLAANQATVARIAKLQFEAAQRIDRRTRAMAQTATETR
ncbi:MAG: hypothetical protein ABFC96_02455 [Thermoguttaceae bacterium]